MAVFVTGGAGFIGSHLAKRLLEGGKQVTVYDNFSSGKVEFLKDSSAGSKLRIVRADVLDTKKLKTAMKGHDLVFHMAANPDVRIGESSPKLELDNGIIATFNVLEAMRKNNIKKIAFASSSVVYGEPTKFPTPENYGPLLPISLYGATKLGSEALISAYCGTFGFSAWIFRFANVVGAKATHGLIYDLVKKLEKNKSELEVLGDGKQKKSYMHVKDCVDAILYTLGKTETNQSSNSSDTGKVGIYNIGNRDQITVGEIAQLLLKEMKLTETRIRYTGTKRGWRGDVTIMHLDASRLNKLGWKPSMNSKESVAAAIREMLQS